MAGVPEETQPPIYRSNEISARLIPSGVSLPDVRLKFGVGVVDVYRPEKEDNLVPGQLLIEFDVVNVESV